MSNEDLETFRQKAHYKIVIDVSDDNGSFTETYWTNSEDHVTSLIRTWVKRVEQQYPRAHLAIEVSDMWDCRTIQALSWLVARMP